MPALIVRSTSNRTDGAALAIARAVAADGGRAHYVGGCVRDALLGSPATDLDIEVFGIDPERLRVLVERVAPVSLVGASFGVLKVHGLPIDVSMPRRETKVGTGHRGFAIDADPSLDPAQAAARRDFTVNAIAWNPLDRELIDPIGGAADLDGGCCATPADSSPRTRCGCCGACSSPPVSG